jgi:uncharacterized membrane protein YeiH
MSYWSFLIDSWIPIFWSIYTCIVHVTSIIEIFLQWLYHNVAWWSLLWHDSAQLEVSALKFVKVEFDLNEKREDTDCMELRCLDVARAYINMHRNIICTQISKNDIYMRSCFIGAWVLAYLQYFLFSPHFFIGKKIVVSIL